MYKQKEHVNRLEEQINLLNSDKDKVKENLSSSQELQEKLNVSNEMLASVFGQDETNEEVEENEQSQVLFKD